MPAVSLATAAPAFADSKVNGLESITHTFTATGGGGVSVTGITGINDGPTPLAANSVTLTLTISRANDKRVWQSYTVSGGWTYVSGTGTTLTFRYANPVPISNPKTAAVALAGTVTADSPNNSGTVEVAITYTG